MNTKNIHMGITEFVESSNGFNMAPDYSFWVPVINCFLNEAENFEIHCWEDEQAAVDEILNGLPHMSCRKEGKVLIVSGSLTVEAKNFIRSHAMDEEGQLKWFSVFLSNPGKELFSSEHYGTEFVGNDLDQKTRNTLHQMMPKETSFYEW